jgi:Glycosyltransferase
MNILFLTDNFPPEVNAPASRTFEHCQRWVARGHKVTVITCAPNFPTGRVFPGYRNRLYSRECVNGIDVIRVWTYITSNEGFVKRALDFMSFMMTGALAALFVRRADIIVGTSPQFFTACAAWFASALKRKPFVFELRDIWPESIRAVGAMKDGWLFRRLESVEMFLYRRAAAIVSVTQSFRRVLGNRGIDMSKISVVTNGVDLSRFPPQAKDARLLAELGFEGKFVAGYIGTHGMAHALETVLDAAKAVQDRGSDDYRFLFLGNGARKEALKARAAELGLTNVVFVDSVPKAQVAQYWSLLDVSIIHLRKADLFETVIPSKIFECMAMGIPIALGVTGEAADIVTSAGCGVWFEPENASALVAVLDSMHADTGRYAQCRANGIAAAKAYDRSTLADRMLEIFSDVLAKRGRNAPSAAEVKGNIG